ncbi:LAFE_0F08746g1_1 [Lachancea fermentati]|uniref:MICOS complex subunit MIC12 n=1 Tax=Lachancea fermentati TaxID=4955 RepID=A0A1G4MFH8_LACFM|nr:LAFE_0F08746g1_1 [Lachancea fermentati]
MSKLLKLTSVSVLTSALGVSYYFYVFDKDGYHYKNASWKRYSDHVQGIIDHKEDIPVEVIGSAPRNVVARPMGETMKDIWNQQVRSTVEWIYSFGSH